MQEGGRKKEGEGEDRETDETYWSRSRRCTSTPSLIAVKPTIRPPKTIQGSPDVETHITGNRIQHRRHLPHVNRLSFLNKVEECRGGGGERQRRPPQAAENPCISSVPIVCPNCTMCGLVHNHDSCQMDTTLYANMWGENWWNLRIMVQLENCRIQWNSEPS